MPRKFPGHIGESLVGRDHAGGDNHRVGILGNRVVEEGLGRFTEGNTLLGHQHERTLDGVGAVLDGFLAGDNTADLNSLHGVFDGGQGGIADGTGVLGHGSDHRWS